MDPLTTIIDRHADPITTVTSVVAVTCLVGTLVNLVVVIRDAIRSERPSNAPTAETIVRHAQLFRRLAAWYGGRTSTALIDAAQSLEKRVGDLEPCGRATHDMEAAGEFAGG